MNRIVGAITQVQSVGKKITLEIRDLDCSQIKIGIMCCPIRAHLIVVRWHRSLDSVPWSAMRRINRLRGLSAQKSITASQIVRKSLAAFCEIIQKKLLFYLNKSESNNYDYLIQVLILLIQIKIICFN